MDWKRYTLTNYLCDKKTHEAIKKKLFKSLGYKNDQLYDVQLVKSEVEQKSPLKIGFFYCNMQNWEF